MRNVLALVLLVTVIPEVAGETITFGQFEIAVQEDNVCLPDSIRWVDHDAQILRSKVGMNLSFTSFEFRSKYYREENRHIWPDQKDPRFVIDAEFVERRELERGDFKGLAVKYRASFADIERSILFHKVEPRFTVEYVVVASRDIVVHESQMFGVGFQLAEGFREKAVLDARTEKNVWLSTAVTRAAVKTGVLHGGPTKFTNSEKRVSVVVHGTHRGDVPHPAPVRLLTLKKGQTLILKTEFILGLQGSEALDRQMRAFAKKLPADQRVFALVDTADVLRAMKDAKHAEEALLLAAMLNREYAEPYARLAALRRDTRGPAQTRAWVEAGYRMPYNYGYMLSGSGFHRTKGLTEAQRRLHIFNVLIAVENTVFYPDYYCWSARGFEEMKMYSQACAIYRQALWAVDNMPRREEYREKVRKRLTEKITDLEAKILNRTNTDLPELIPVQVGQP